MVTLGEGRNTRTVDSQFMVVSCRSTYKCIVGIPLATTLDMVVSLVYLIMKYHNVYDESIVINVVLSMEKRIYKAL